MKLLLALFTVVGTSVLGLNPQNEVLPALLSARRSAQAWNNPNPPKSVTILACTDIHGNVEHIERIVTFYDAYKDYIEDAIHTGDVVGCFWDDPNPWDHVAGAEKIMNLVGNHDCWKGHLSWNATGYPYDAKQEDSYASILVGKDKKHPFVDNWGVTQPEGVNNKKSEHYCACYYYKDYPQASVRLVALDCLHYEEAQNSWLAATLKDALNKNLDVMIAVHFASQYGIDEFEDNPFTETDFKIEPVVPQAGFQLCKTPAVAYDTVEEFIANGGRFVSWICGDEHHDCVGTVTGYPRQLSITMDKSGDGDCYMTEDRTPGTRNQDSFNLVTINPSKNIIVVQRIGCQYDCKMRRHTIFCYDYVQHKLLAAY